MRAVLAEDPLLLSDRLARLPGAHDFTIGDAAQGAPDHSWVPYPSAESAF